MFYITTNNCIMFIFQMLAKEFQPPKQPDPILKQPVLINYHDDISCRLNHLKPFVGLDARKAELEMMGHLPSSNLNNFPHPSEKASKERAARLQELIHFCSNSSLGPAGSYHYCEMYAVLNCCTQIHSNVTSYAVF